MIITITLHVTVDVGYDGPELIDIENAAMNPVHALRIQDKAGVSVRIASGSHAKSLEVQQRKPGCHGDTDDDDRSVDATDQAEHENIATQRTGEKLVISFSK